MNRGLGTKSPIDRKVKEFMKAGQIVQATAGRDKDRFFVVMQTDGKYVMLCDGKTRPVDRPKKKKIIHVKETQHSVFLQEVLTNKALRKVLHPFNYPKQHPKEEISLCPNKM